MSFAFSNASVLCFAYFRAVSIGRVNHNIRRKTKKEENFFSSSLYESDD
jgi:hypothetical protein